MSKKTIAFTMPPAARAPRERTPVVLDGVTGESVGFAAAEESLRDAGTNSKTDEWVRDRPSRDAARPVAGFRGAAVARFAFGAGVTINLASERNLMEAMTLSLMVPFALGWFWWLNAIARPIANGACEWRKGAYFSTGFSELRQKSRVRLNSSSE